VCTQSLRIWGEKRKYETKWFIRLKEIKTKDKCMKVITENHYKNDITLLFFPTNYVLHTTQIRFHM